MSRLAAGLGLAALLLTLVGGQGASAAIGPNPAGHTDRRITDRRITESSGLAPSLLHSGVLWTHNDSGNPPRIYAIGKSGSTLAALTLQNEPDVDWEAITSLRGPATSLAPGAALIAVGDLGDNNAEHSSVRIAIVREPQELRSSYVTPIRVLRLRYPGGPRDAEALLADPRTGQFYIVSKTLFGSELYSVPRSVWPGNARTGVSPITTMTRVARMSASLITDGAFLPDGRMLLRGYGQVYVLDKPSSVKNDRIKTLASGMLPDQDQGESMAVVDGGKQALIGSEGKREPVLRITVPTVPGDRALAQVQTPSTGSGSAESKAGGSRTAGTSSGHSLPSLGGRRLLAGVAGAGFVLIGLVAVLVLLRTRDPIRRR
jgi:hypothetical protein